jgi:PPOX class probable F420-dependent enzyme
VRPVGHTVDMRIDDALTFLDANHRAVLATRRDDGRPQLSPVNAGVLDGAVVISSRAMLAKVRNLRVRPEASVLVLNDRFYGPWAQLEGPAEVLDQTDPATLGLLDDVYRTIAGEHPDWSDYRAAMIRDERVVIRIRPSRATGQL